MVEYLAGNRIRGTSTERTALTTGAPDYELGTEADGIATDPSFTNTGSNDVSYDSTNDELDITPATNNWGGSHTVAYYKDILGETISDTEWVLRMKWVQQSWTTNTGSSGNDVHVDLSSVITNNLSGDTSGVVIHNWSSNQGLGLDVINDSSTTNTENYEKVITPTATTYYIQMRRLDTDDFDIKIYTNSDFSTGQQGSTETKTVTGLANLRYLRMFSQFQSGASGVGNMSIKWFKFWNDTTTATSISYNIQDGSIFYETDTNKSYVLNNNTWSEV